jgi:putative DNA primase/helicase
MLAGARLCTISEVPAGAQWDEGLLKDVTGGGRMTASFKHKNEFSFEPLFKLTALGNHQPTFPGGISPAIRRRFRMMEFPFVPKVVDLDLMKKLQKEWPGILRWALDGCRLWAGRGGLTVPLKVTEATDGFFQEQDLLGRWLAERVVKTQGSKVQASDLFRDWIEWRNAEGSHSDFNTPHAFAKEMTDQRGFAKKAGRMATEYLDIALKSKAATAFDGD